MIGCSRCVNWSKCSCRRPAGGLCSCAASETVFAHAGKFSEAEAQARRVLALAQQAYGGHDAKTLHVKICLGEILRMSGQTEQAEAIYREVLGACSALSTDHPVVLNVQGSLAACLCDHVNLVEAEEMLRQVLLVVEEAGGADKDLLGSSSFDIDPLSSGLSDYGMALLVTRIILARVLKESGKFEAAEEMERELLIAMEGAFAGRNAHLTDQQFRVAAILADNGKLEESTELLRKVLETRERCFGHDHIQVAHVRWWLGRVLIQRGDVGLAEELLRRALRVQVDVLGTSHPEAVSTRRDLVSALQKRGKMKEVEEVMRASSECFQQTK